MNRCKAHVKSAKCCLNSTEIMSNENNEMGFLPLPDLASALENKSAARAFPGLDVAIGGCMATCAVILEHNLAELN